MLTDQTHDRGGAPEPDAAAGGAGAPPHPEAPNRAPRVTCAYATDRLTVAWYAERCIHSANCVRALPRVFDPRRRPWVDVAAAGPTGGPESAPPSAD